eukprot:Em0004g226a
MSVHAGFGRSPAAELSDRPEETLIIDCADRAEEPPALKKRKSGVLTKPNDSAIHPSGPKFINSWLWKHYKLSPRSDCDKWGLCVVCQKAGEITWVSRVDESHTAESIATLLKECHEVQYQMGTRLDSITMVPISKQQFSNCWMKM